MKPNMYIGFVYIKVKNENVLIMIKYLRFTLRKILLFMTTVLKTSI